MNFDVFVSAILGKPVSHAWRGHGGTIFLEIGELKPGRTRRDGSIGNEIGDFTIHLDPDWRFEGARSILQGSDDSSRSIERFLSGLIGEEIKDLRYFGRLPELEIAVSRGVIRTFSAWKGQPNWTIHRWVPPMAMFSQFGRIKFDGDPL